MDGPGRLIVVYGSMFSGKTERLIAWLRAGTAAGRRVVAVKHAIDDRYDADHLITHPGDRFPAVRAASAEAIPGCCEGADAVAIDEGHFFGPALPEVVGAMRSRGVSVMVAGLMHDAWGRPFAPMPQLAAAADEVVTCLAPCHVCGRPSEFTQRMVPVTSPTMIGGAESYEPRCAEHFRPLGR